MGAARPSSGPRRDEAGPRPSGPGGRTRGRRRRRRLCRRCEVLLSICPPHAAVDVARLRPDSRDLRRRERDRARHRPGRRGAPAAVRRRRHRRAAADQPETTRLYLSGEEAADVVALFAGTHVDARVLSGRPGAASALKAAYAGWTKGSAALLLTVSELAQAEGVEDALLAEWRLSIPELEERLAGAERSARRKGWRWIGEMEEIADGMAARTCPPASTKPRPRSSPHRRGVAVTEPLSVADYEGLAEERLEPRRSPTSRGVRATSGRCSENLAAFPRWTFRPRVLSDVTGSRPRRRCSVRRSRFPWSSGRWRTKSSSTRTASARPRAALPRRAPASPSRRSARARTRRSRLPRPGDAVVPAVRLPGPRRHPRAPRRRGGRRLQRRRSHRGHATARTAGARPARRLRDPFRVPLPYARAAVGEAAHNPADQFALLDASLSWRDLEWLAPRDGCQ